MNKWNKSLTAILIGALSSCGVAVHAPAQDEPVEEMRVARDTEGNYMIYIHPTISEDCAPQGGFLAVREDVVTGEQENGCWDLDNDRTQLVTWWPLTFDVIYIPPQNVTGKKNSDSDP